MSMMSQMGDMYKLQKQAKQMKKDLANTHVFAEVEGVKVTVSCEQKVIDMEILDPELLNDQAKLIKFTIDATNRAFTKAQEIAAAKMQEMMGGMGGLGAMMGGGQQ